MHGRNRCATPEPADAAFAITPCRNTVTTTFATILKSPSPDIAELNEIVGDILRDDRRAGEVIRRMTSLLAKAPFELKVSIATRSRGKASDLFRRWLSPERSN
jgi:hypothetical protein